MDKSDESGSKKTKEDDEVKESSNYFRIFYLKIKKGMNFILNWLEK